MWWRCAQAGGVREQPDVRDVPDLRLVSALAPEVRLTPDSTHVPARARAQPLLHLHTITLLLIYVLV